jgi:transcriptional regulator of acetoin/glycerol metabolism
MPDVQSRDNCNTSSLLPLAKIERAHTLQVLQACEGNIAVAARTLQMNRATLYRRIAEYNGT